MHANLNRRRDALKNTLWLQVCSNVRQKIPKISITFCTRREKHDRRANETQFTSVHIREVERHAGHFIQRTITRIPLMTKNSG